MPAKQSANISLQPGGSTAARVIKNYVKQGDSVTFSLDPQSKQLRKVRVQLYLNDPSNGE